MKTLSIYALSLGLITACQPSADQTTAAVAGEVFLTARQIMEKTRQYYDPQNQWDTFSGKVRLTTTYNNSTGEEIIEIHNAEHSYKCTCTWQDNVTVKGIENRACFQEANGEKNLSEATLQQFNLGCDGIKFSQQHHTGHFGLVMQIMEAGMDMSEEVKQEEFRCQPVYTLSFAGDASKVIHPYWEGKMALYISPENYALLGYLYNSAFYQANVALEGELEVNGIRMPQTKLYYNTEDGSYIFTDVFRAM